MHTPLSIEILLHSLHKLTWVQRWPYLDRHYCIHTESCRRDFWDVVIPGLEGKRIEIVRLAMVLRPHNQILPVRSITLEISVMHRSSPDEINRDLRSNRIDRDRWLSFPA